MNKFQNYDLASKSYIALLGEVAAGERHVVDLIPASASVQDALEEIRDLNVHDRAFVDATAAYLKGLAWTVKGNTSIDLETLQAEYTRARRRVIVEAPVSAHRSFAAAA